MPTIHAFLSPSSSKRWMTCTPSAVAESAYDEQSSAFAMEGTLAHSLAEFMLTFYKTGHDLMSFDELKSFWPIGGASDIQKGCDEQGLDFWEMAQTVHDYYVTPVFEDYLQALDEDPAAQLLIEAPLNLASFIPEGFGTSDAILIYGDHLTVYDLKYGKGVRVNAEHNTQMMCYALGALYGPGELSGVHTVTMTIIQPRLQHYSSYELSYDTLVAWGEIILKPAAKKAFRGEGEYMPGPHCKFCKASARCRVLYLYNRIKTEAYGQPETLTDEELAEALNLTETVKNWICRIEEYALGQALSGKKLQGWKVVEGRSIRKITDQEGAIRELNENGFTPNMYLKPAELKTISELEKMLGKKGKDIIKPYISKLQGKPVLAQENDKRPEWLTAAEDFKETIL